ncbi:MAG: 4'-phosphopantetheinyl transferase superfamily protein [Bacteroidales bacterium]|nr:4'-phosphopantetheinyl transferase superfamily protein [Bacteroidales bacterium]
MEYFVCHIDKAREMFGEDKTLSTPKQISSWAKQLLIQKVEEKGFEFNSKIEKTVEGKPFFLFNQSLHFSISHTKEFIAIALSDKPIGIDIEKKRKYNKAVVHRFFHPKEVELLEKTKDEEDQDILFTKIWTIKEAYVKCTGTGIANSFNIFQINPLTNPPQIQNTPIEVEIQSYFIDQNSLFLSLCQENS